MVCSCVGRPWREVGRGNTVTRIRGHSSSFSGCPLSLLGGATWGVLKVPVQYREAVGREPFSTRENGQWYPRKHYPVEWPLMRRKPGPARLRSEARRAVRRTARPVCSAVTILVGRGPPGEGRRRSRKTASHGRRHPKRRAYRRRVASSRNAAIAA